MQAFYRGIGDTSTRVDRFEPEMNRLDGDKDTITPGPVGRATSHRLFVDRGLAAVGGLARRCCWAGCSPSPTGADRIKAGVPAGWRVAHKTGTGGYGPTNDIGVLYPPSGAPIIVAAYYHATRGRRRRQNEAVIAEADPHRRSTALGRA